MKLFVTAPDETTPDKRKKLYLTEESRDLIDRLLKKLPPKTDITQITGVSITSQAIYNYVKYRKPLSRRGVEACEALVNYFSAESEQTKGIALDVAIRVVKQHGGKVTF